MFFTKKISLVKIIDDVVCNSDLINTLASNIKMAEFAHNSDDSKLTLDDSFDDNSNLFEDDIFWKLYTNVHHFAFKFAQNNTDTKKNTSNNIEELFINRTNNSIKIYRGLNYGYIENLNKGVELLKERYTMDLLNINKLFLNPFIDFYSDADVPKEVCKKIIDSEFSSNFEKLVTSISNAYLSLMNQGEWKDK